MSYVDGFVVPVPTAKREAYIALARTAAQVFRTTAPSASSSAG